MQKVYGVIHIPSKLYLFSRQKKTTYVASEPQTIHSPCKRIHQQGDNHGRDDGAHEVDGGHSVNLGHRRLGQVGSDVTGAGRKCVGTKVYATR